MDLSVVAPVYNEAECISAFCDKVHAVLSAMDLYYEIILVDDGSADGTWQALRACSERIPHMKLIRFRRNFGQTAAMSAGFHHASGDIIITMDSDLQNDPEDIPQLLEHMREDVDVVSGWRKERKDPFLHRRLPSMLANVLISKITNVHLHDYGCTLKAYRRKVIENVHLYGEMHRFIPALASWAGDKIVEVPVRHHSRQLGQSKYGLSRTGRVILDLITVKFLLRYRMDPMQLFGKIGLIFGVPGLLLLCFMMGANMSYHLFGTVWASELIKRPFWIMTAFMMIFLGMQFISMGLLAEVQIRTYHESQDKPTYVIREILDS
jgi:glycosyltransferase involved in cell wall biosynthesis